MSEKSFASLNLATSLQAVIDEIGFKEMTPIQAQSIPLLLGGKDLIGQSKTGSGKTAAFALPILNKISLEGRELQTLILCPTRELCAQVAREIRRLGRRLSDLQVLLLVGGQPGKPQTEALHKGVHIVVGTPGRVLDHLQRGTLDLGALTTLVLDEADRMLDMGFADEMQAILEVVPEARQTLLFSATFPAGIKKISAQFQNQPVHIQVDDGEEPLIEQYFCPMEAEEKQDLLLRFLKKVRGSVLIFCNQKAAVHEIGEELFHEGLKSGVLHGDLEQRDRDQVLALFRNGTTPILVATDVAARGLDIKDLDLVINFDAPYEAPVYVHRIGRTGRAGKKGVALTLATEVERQRLREIAQSIDVKINSISLDKLAGQLASNDSAPSMQTVFISGGRKDKLRPGDILGALTGEAGGLKAGDIGKIEIHDNFSYVAVERKVAATAVEKLKTGRIKGKRFPVKLL